MITPLFYVFCSDSVAQWQSHIMDSIYGRMGEETQRSVLSLALTGKDVNTEYETCAISSLRGHQINDVAAVCVRRVRSIQLPGVTVDRKRVSLLFVVRAVDTDIDVVASLHCAMREQMDVNGIMPFSALLWIVDDQPENASIQRTLLSKIADDDLGFEMTLVMSDRTARGDSTAETEMDRYTMAAFAGLFIRRDVFLQRHRNKVYGEDAIVFIPGISHIRRPRQEIRAILNDTLARKVLEVSERSREMVPLLAHCIAPRQASNQHKNLDIKSSIVEAIRGVWNLLLPEPIDVLAVARNVTAGQLREAVLKKRVADFIWDAKMDDQASVHITEWIATVKNELESVIRTQPEVDLLALIFSEGGLYEQDIEQASDTLAADARREYADVDDRGRRVMEQSWAFENRSLFLYGLEQIIERRLWILLEMLGRLSAIRQQLHSYATACGVNLRDAVAPYILTPGVLVGKCVC